MKSMVRLAAVVFSAAMVFTCGCVSPKTTAGGAAMSTPGPTDPDAPTDFSATASGLKYKVLRRTDGVKPTVRSMVTVNYKGWLDNGKVFDSSYDRSEPTSFGLSQVVPGWTEGLQLVGEGGMIELEIPPQLGYGPQGSPGAIPPNATLHFIVELLKVQ